MNYRAIENILLLLLLLLLLIIIIIKIRLPDRGVYFNTKQQMDKNSYIT